MANNSEAAGKGEHPGRLRVNLRSRGASFALKKVSKSEHTPCFPVLRIPNAASATQSAKHDPRSRYSWIEDRRER